MEDLKILLSKLKENYKHCEEKAIDLSIVTFNVSEKGEIFLNDNGNLYFFKNDPENPNDPKIVYAAKQFCKICKIPFSFFYKNPDYMMANLVKCWLPTVKPDDAVIMAKLRRTGVNTVIRALLPAEFTNISNSEIMGIVSEATKDDFEIEFAIGVETDDLIMHIRLISKEKFTAIGETCAVGFSIVASELGASPIFVETILHRESSKTSFIASYSGDSFFYSEYEGIQPNDLKTLFPRLVERLKGQLGDIKNLIQSSKEISENRESIMELLQQLKLKKGLNEKFHNLLSQEIKDISSSKIDRWTFANKIALIAKEFPVDKRVRIEKIAGDLIGLRFEKI